MCGVSFMLRPSPRPLCGTWRHADRGGCRLRGRRESSPRGNLYMYNTLTQRRSKVSGGPESRGWSSPLREVSSNSLKCGRTVSSKSCRRTVLRRWSTSYMIERGFNRVIGSIVVFFDCKVGLCQYPEITKASVHREMQTVFRNGSLKQALGLLMSQQSSHNSAVLQTWPISIYHTRLGFSLPESCNTPYDMFTPKPSGAANFALAALHYREAWDGRYKNYTEWKTWEHKPNAVILIEKVLGCT